MSALWTMLPSFPAPCLKVQARPDGVGVRHKELPDLFCSFPEDLQINPSRNLPQSIQATPLMGTTVLNSMGNATAWCKCGNKYLQHLD